METQTSRRALLGSMMLAPFAGAVAAVPSVATTSNLHRAAWDQAVAAYDAAKRTADDYEQRVYRPMSEALGPFPNNTFTITALNGAAATYDWCPGRPDDWLEQPGKQFHDGVAECKRKWADYQARRDRLDANTIDCRADALSEAACNAEWAIFYTPAPDGEAFLRKLDHLFAGPDNNEDGCCPSWSSKVIEALLSDARRLLGGEALA